MNSPFKIETKTEKKLLVLFEVKKAQKGRAVIRTSSGEDLTMYEGDTLTFTVPLGLAKAMEDLDR